MKFKLFPFILFIFISCSLWAQTLKQEKYEPEDAQEQQEYDKEFTYGINWNTNGGIIGGINLKYAWQTKANQLIYNLLGLEIVHVVHPKESAVASSSRFASAYVYGKATNMFVFRPHIGREWLIFKKAEEEGIQVSAILTGGLSLAYLKPYYVVYGDTTTENGEEILVFKTEKFEYKKIDSRNIYGAGSFLLGFDEMKSYLGTHVKASLNFEYGKFQSSVAGVEIGTMLEYFPSKPVIIPEAYNPNFFPSLFINLYFGIR